jgi:hypothetical protein
LMTIPGVDLVVVLRHGWSSPSGSQSPPV